MKKNDHNTTDLTKRPLSFTEAAFLADNLETIEHFRELQRKADQQMSYDSNAPLSFGGKVLAAILALIFLYAFGSIAYAVIDVLLMTL